MLKEWLEYLEEQVGKSVYLWGGQGKRAAEVGDVKAYIYARAQDSEKAARVWKFYQQLSGTGADIRFFDCSGLAMYFFQNLKGVATGDATAHGIWGGCTKIGKAELKPGDFAFKQTDGRMTHIGYVAADGCVIEARASGYGVEKRPLSAGGWTHFGRHKWLKAEIEDSAKATVEKMETVAKPEAKRTVKQWQNFLLMYDPNCLPRYGADGKYGSETDQAAAKLIADLETLRKEKG